MKALIIGGTGTISRAVVRSLIARGAEVTIFNRGSRQVTLPDGIEVIRGDRLDRGAFEAAFRGREFDVVYDVISFFPDDARSAIRAFSGNVGHFIHLSTVMTYGPPFAGDGVGLDEHSPLNGQRDGGYGEGKVAADALILEAAAAGGLPATIVKPSMTFGEGRHLLRQVDWWPGWIQRMKAGLPLLSAGDGTNLFQMLPSQSMGEALAMLAGRSGSVGEIYNIVNPQALSWDHWMRVIGEVAGVEPELVHVPTDTLLAADPERFGRIVTNFAHTQVFSGAKFQALVPEWQPVPVQEGIADALEWMDEFLPDASGDAEWVQEDRLIAAIRDFNSGLSARLG